MKLYIHLFIYLSRIRKIFGNPTRPQFTDEVGRKLHFSCYCFGKFLIKEHYHKWYVSKGMKGRGKISNKRVSGRRERK